jgi:hypothetical protein
LRALGHGLLAAVLASGCAARGHLATPGEIASLMQASGLSASGRISLKGARGRFSTGVVFGVARPDALRIEIPDGAGLRFLLVSKDGRLRADLPREEAMFEGRGTREVMNELFGIDLDPASLVGALLGSTPDGFQVSWRFDRSRPAQVSIEGPGASRLTLTFDDPSPEAPSGRAFEFPRPRGNSLSLRDMSERLGLRR